MNGTVENRTNGVHIVVEGAISTVHSFKNDIIRLAPEPADIKSIKISRIQGKGYSDFQISSSRAGKQIETEVGPDIAVCPECLTDLKTQVHRLNYPFINCTICGPRFTIIKELPYDRDKTTMRVFPMCPKCEAEYYNINDRRFHAQPVACNHCGPVYFYKDTKQNTSEFNRILTLVAELISDGRIVAVKGLGGYHLICDALNDKAVSLLREKKQRDSKPFAVLFRDIKIIKEFCYLNHFEEETISSWRRPVLLLKQKMPLAYQVNNGLTTSGVMLPYMPLHYLLFEKLSTPAIVFTSGNFSDEPVIIDDLEAEKKLFPMASALVSYNREIYNRADDSVARIIGQDISLIRRSRGYAPSPVHMDVWADGLLAVGADQKNCFALGKQKQAIISQHIGDLHHSETLSFFRESVERFSSLYRFVPSAIVCDLHPNYISTNYAKSLAKDLNIPIYTVQHHHAHIASCIAEHRLNEKVIGISLDGTGYGTDGNIWGGEFLIADAESFIRYAHFDYVPMPGGEKAVKEPWRMAVSYLYKYFGQENLNDKLLLSKKIQNESLVLVREMIAKKINSPLSSGAGRLFDAVAALTGVCMISGFEAEAPMRLESLTTDGIDEYYPFSAENEIVCFKDTFTYLLDDLLAEKPVSLISTMFHNTIAQVIRKVSVNIRKDTGLNLVVLSGGVFQNKYLLEKSIELLTREKFRVFTNNLVPANDGGIALGQLLIASKIRSVCV